LPPPDTLSYSRELCNVYQNARPRLMHITWDRSHLWNCAKWYPQQSFVYNIEFCAVLSANLIVYGQGAWILHVCATCKRERDRRSENNGPWVIRGSCFTQRVDKYDYSH
jgi:hypothetical protein